MSRSLRRIRVPDLALLRLRREIRIAIALAAVVVIAAFAVALHFVQPAPPDRIVMSTGRTDGDYHRYGLEYRKILAQQGVELQLVSSEGALENIGRLMDPAMRVDVAFFQSGTGFAANAPNVVSLGTLYYEPLWVFYRGAPITELHELNGKRIALGAEQSGTRPLALQLLAVNSAVLRPNRRWSNSSSLPRACGCSASTVRTPTSGVSPTSPELRSRVVYSTWWVTSLLATWCCWHLPRIFWRATACTRRSRIC
jgi:hypothetical protein